MLKLPVILSIAHFVVVFGIRLIAPKEGIPHWAENAMDSGASFAKDFEFILTQPGRWICDTAGWANGSALFWLMMIATSILWGCVVAFAVRRLAKLIVS